MEIMMSVNDLSHQIDAYHEWKNRLGINIQLYQSWLEENRLNTDDVSRRLTRGLELLKDDQLTIAMVGEYSRGKTELINALVFTEFGQRMLPSQAGRTTMCPTEIYYDPNRNHSYIKLLPIETRAQGKSISELKNDASSWKEFEVDSSNPESMSQTLKQVARTKSVRLSDARLLGFDEKMLESAPDEQGLVIIPVWRHALMSLDSPLLKKGLRILDTPGLNALGSEPELTISMVPKAQAIIFLLSADAGVTASDLAIWKRFIQTKDADHRAGRFAVLNKIDVLWDDLQGDTHIAASIEQVRKSTAQHLGIDIEDVLPLSAKQGLIARVKKDDLLLQKSALPKLEKLISKRVLKQKEQLILDDLIDDVKQMLLSSQSILNERLSVLYKEYDALEEGAMSTQVLQGIADKTQQEHETYYKKLITLKSSRRLMQSQGEILTQIMGDERFKDILKQTKRALNESWSTLGMTHTMNQFFVRMNKELDNICTEARLADKMVAAIYKRFKSDIKVNHLKPKVFSVDTQREELAVLRKKLLQYCRQPKMFMTEQSILVAHFFNTFVAEVRIIQEAIVLEAKQWPDAALLPLMQYAQEQKMSLEELVANLRRMARDTRDNKIQQTELKKVIDETHVQLDEAEKIQHKIESPAPSQLADIQDIAIR